ncbi:MAG: hypothetical protein ACNS64_09165 [Candidatus Halalkalibacterium sp. M3_1C_030]
MKERKFSIHTLTTIFTLGLLTVFIGCESITEPEANTDLQSSGHAQSKNINQEKPLTIDQQFSEIAEQIPGGFGGIFYDENDQLTIYLKDPEVKAQATSAIEAISSVAARTPVVSKMQSLVNKGDLQVRKGQYSFSELNEWRYKALEGGIFEVPDVQTLDVGDSSNRLEIGIKGTEEEPLSDAIKQSVVQKLVKLGIPEEAIVLEKVGAIQDYTHTLRSDFDPNIGGSRVQAQGIGGCTLGVSVEYLDGGTWHLGFLTASHCVPPRHQMNGTAVYQPYNPTHPNYSSGMYVGDEVYNAVLSNTDCRDGGNPCYWADVAIIDYDSGNSAVGNIGRTPLWGNTYAIDQSNPRFYVDDVYTDYQHIEFLGERVNKVGQRTGWTDGDVSDICIDLVPNDGVLNRCQVGVEEPPGAPNYLLAYFGDSGSPVFRLTGETAGDGSDYVEILGILWGGETQGSTHHFYYSQLWTINAHGGLPDYNILLHSDGVQTAQ